MVRYESRLYQRSLGNYGQLVFMLKCIFGLMLLSLGFMSCYFLLFPYKIFPQILIGAIYVHLVELQHEALHGAIERKDLNRLIGFILGLPMLISYSDYKYHHMIHHEYIGTDKNTEYFTYNDTESITIKQFLISLFMFSHYKTIFVKIVKSLHGQNFDVGTGNIREKIKKEYQIFAIIITLSLLSSLYFKSFLFLELWLVPVFLFSAPIHFLIELPEHVFCETKSPIIFKNTRTIKSNSFMSWFVNGNNYHVEHHFMPNIPISLLATLHPDIEHEIIHYERSYLEFYSKFFKRQINKKENLK